MPSASEETRQEWKNRILSQRSSGLSVSAWCKENNILYHVFNYWKDRLFTKSHLNRDSFIELKNKNRVDQVTVILECQNIRIYLSEHVDVATLKKYFEALKTC